MEIISCVTCEEVVAITVDGTAPGRVVCVSCYNASEELGVTDEDYPEVPEVITINPEDLVGIPYSMEHVQNVYPNPEEALEYLGTYGHLPDTPAEQCMAEEYAKLSEDEYRVAEESGEIYRRHLALVGDREKAHQMALEHVK